MSDTTLDTLEASVVRRIRAIRVLPVVTLERAEYGRSVGEALMAGGVACMEVGFRTPCAAEAIRSARKVEGLLVGAGTILSVESLEKAIAAGAQFAVAPGTNEEIMTAARELGLPFFPGAATPTEIDRARRLGARTVKIFPAAEVGGPSFLRAVAATFPELGFIPTGGIHTDTLADYLGIESVVGCGGTWITPQELVPERLDEVQRRAREAAEAVS
jgi:2-dehydro-3-deoxyphosphogluconate aldolase/(4S)-4-hydroxy-2-oxoglutarate aldolase